MVEGHGRYRRDFSPATLEPATGGAISKGRPRSRKRRRRGAHAGELAHEPTHTPAGEGNGWGQHTVTGGDGCAARLPDGVTLSPFPVVHSTLNGSLAASASLSPNRSQP